MTTITVEVEDDVWARAKALAASRKMSLAEMVKRLLRVVSEPPLDRRELPPQTREALGLLPPMTDEEVEKTLDEERVRKYGPQ